MSDIKYIGGVLRMKAFEKLKVFLGNPGKFCLIILGGRGSGKHFAIESAFKEIKTEDNDELCLKKIEFIAAVKVPSTETELDEWFMKNTFKTLVIEDVEQLTSEQQDLLFTALSTTDGTFGINERFKLRIAFTSSKNVDELREDENQLKGLFWDRISQLVVEFPTYQDESGYILEDFQATWVKMKFQETKGFEHFGKQPKNAALERFLEEYAEKFEGGFRDLDKLACMYFNYRILHYGKIKKIDDTIEKRIVEDIKNDFIGKSQLHSSWGNDFSTFQIKPGFTMDDLIGQFKIQVRNWGKKTYDTYALAEKKLGLGQGTMKNWTEKKVTKSRKANFTKSLKPKAEIMKRQK